MKIKEFIKKFLENFSMILNDENQLVLACLHFQQSDPGAERYACRNLFGLQGWTDHHAKTFSAAFAEALQQTTTFFTTDERVLNDTKLKAIHDHSHEIKTRLVPQITADVNLGDPMPKVRKNVERQLEQLNSSPYSVNNRYVLYGGLAASALLAAAFIPSLAPK